MFAQYIEEKKEYGTSPAFYLDCSDVFRKAGKKDLALQILSILPNSNWRIQR